jgi:hypothetical protein
MLVSCNPNEQVDEADVALLEIEATRVDEDKEDAMASAWRGLIWLRNYRTPLRLPHN